MLFLDLCDKKNKKRRYELYTTEISAKRLGMYPWYTWWGTVGRFRKGKAKGFFEKRRERMEIAKENIVYPNKFIPFRPFFVEGILTRYRKKEIMDLFMFANEAKSESIKTIELGKKMKPEEVIPLEICSIARIASKKDLPIFSFNEDFQYFCKIPNKDGQYINYWKPSTFLQNLTP